MTARNWHSRGPSHNLLFRQVAEAMELDWTMQDDSEQAMLTAWTEGVIQ